MERLTKRSISSLLTLDWRTEIGFHDHAHTKLVLTLTTRLVEHCPAPCLVGGLQLEPLEVSNPTPHLHHRSNFPSCPNMNPKTQNSNHEHCPDQSKWGMSRLALWTGHFRHGPSNWELQTLPTWFETFWNVLKRLVVSRMSLGVPLNSIRPPCRVGVYPLHLIRGKSLF